MIIVVSSIGGFQLATWTNKCNDLDLPVRPGINTFRIEFQHLRLLPGRYSLGIGVRDSRGSDDWIPEAVQFEIISSLEAAKINAETFDSVFVLSATVSVID